MDWGRAKNLIIFFLCLLNVAMFALIYTNNRAYRLTQSRERSITAVLAANDIISYVDIIKTFFPMRQIEMSPPEYDAELLPSIFMRVPENAARSTERNRIIYRNESETLVIDGPAVTYRRYGGGDGGVNLEEAERLCAALLKNLKKIGGAFAADGRVPIETEDGWLFSYRGTYRGYVVNSNSVEITVGADGITRVDFTYYKPVSFVGVRRDICSADEALLTAMRGIKKIRGDKAETLFITGMDVVYHKNLATRATPYYRVFVSGFDAPFLINAYENTIL